jgi:hypothetical protein
MVKFKNRLDQLETNLQKLIEGSVAHLFPNGPVRGNLASRLVEAMLAAVKDDRDGGNHAPDQFILYLAPVHAGLLREDSALMSGLTQLLGEIGRESNLLFANPVTVRIIEAPQFAPGEVQVIARHASHGLPDTSAVRIAFEPKDTDFAPANSPAQDFTSPGAGFLIVDGTRIYALEQPVINIGRNAENHLVLDDGRVSRLHAQIRLVRGRYTIFDLESTGGTWVNGKRIHQHGLLPGDVISLAGLPIVYGENRLRQDETQDYAPDTSPSN